MNRIAITAALLALAFAPAADAAEHRLGLGLHYWSTIDSVGDLEGIEDEGSSWLVTYQLKPAGFFKLELDVEVFDEGFAGSTDTSFAPQAFVLVGGFVYGGVGAGVTVSDGLQDNVSDPFFMVKLGLDFTVLPRVHLDVGAIYRFDDWEAVEEVDFDSDTYTLGVAARVVF